MEGKEGYIGIRYLILVFIVLVSYPLVYSALSFLTIYPSLWLVRMVYHYAILLPGTDTLFINGYYISLIEACIGVAAYYLLLILNLTTPMSLLTRVKSILSLIFSFLILNIIRIFLFTLLFINGYSFFNLTHLLTWYAGSTILLAVLWFVNVWAFRINGIPIYSDITYLLKKAGIGKEKSKRAYK